MDFGLHCSCHTLQDAAAEYICVDIKTVVLVTGEGVNAIGWPKLFKTT